MIILGAGLSGLIAAHLYPLAMVIEARPKSEKAHRALLRFRTAAVGEAVGIEFRKVTVQKGIFLDSRYVQPDIRVANMYSTKVASGRLLNRSIWNIDPVERYVAPDDFIERLTAQIGNRIAWNSPIKNAGDIPGGETVISTMPMPVLAKVIEQDHLLKGEKFLYSGIKVDRYRVPGADVFQTVYFPSPETSVYRASITKDTLIIESIDSPGSLEPVFDAFSISEKSLIPLESNHKQQYGKIVPINDSVRRAFIQKVTRSFDIYSVGRFALWKNILLDDVLHDLSVIKRLISSDEYSRNLINGETA